MESKDLLWLSLFTLLLVFSNFLCFMVVSSLQSKALGQQSIYDQVVKDTFSVGNVFCSWVCLVVIITRFSSCRVQITESDLLLTLICGMTMFIRLSLCIFTCSLCIIRVLCIFKMAFLEKTIGEGKIRQTYFIISLLVGVFILIILFIHDEIISGLLLSYKGNYSSHKGKMSSNIIRQCFSTFFWVAKTTVFVVALRGHSNNT
jgi:hypothetical protein